jgi:hypothetical protein
LRAESRDGTVQSRFDVFAFAEFTSQIAGNALVRRTAHELEGFADLLVRIDRQKGRLLELDSKGLLQCSIKNRVAGGVDEVGEDDGVFVGKFGGVCGAPVKPDGEKDGCGDGCKQQIPRSEDSARKDNLWVLGSAFLSGT